MAWCGDTRVPHARPELGTFNGSQACPKFQPFKPTYQFNIVFFYFHCFSKSNLLHLFSINSPPVLILHVPHSHLTTLLLTSLLPLTLYLRDPSSYLSQTHLSFSLAIQISFCVREPTHPAREKQQSSVFLWFPLILDRAHTYY